MGKGRSGQHGVGHNLCLVKRPWREGDKCDTAEIWEPGAGLLLARGRAPAPGLACRPGSGPAGSWGQGHLLQYPQSYLAHLLLPASALKHGWGRPTAATPPRAWLAPRAWVALLCPAQSLDTLVALASPLAPPILTAHSFPLFPAQVSSGGPGIMGSAHPWNPLALQKRSPVSSGVGWGSQLFQ